MPSPEPLPLRNIATSLRASLKATFSPATAQLLQEAVSPEPDFDVITSILKLDPALASAILSLVNSPFYGQPGKISDLQRAAIILGNNEILRIALSLSLQKNLNAILEKNGFDTYANWRIIIWAALGAELVAEQLIPQDKDTAYICALIKDLSLLLYAATFPEHVLPKITTPDFVNTGPSFMSWQDHIPADHAALTAELLADWNFPDRMVAAITAHHDLEHVLERPPLHQAVIFGTRWAEVEFRNDPNPDGLHQLQFLLSKAGVLPATGLEGLRQRCIGQFNDLSAAMNIKELPLENRLYAHSLQSVQDFQSQAKELEGLTGGNVALARCIGRHLRWNWTCREAEIILFAPAARQWERFQLRSSGLSGPDYATEPHEFRSSGGLSIALETEGRTIGELRLLDIPSTTWAKAEAALYARLAARSLWRQMNTVGTLELKAEILDILPTGVALLNEHGRLVRANPTFMRFLDGSPSLEERLAAGNDPVGLRVLRTWRDFLNDPKQLSHCGIHCDLSPGSNPEDPAFSLNGYRIRQNGQVGVLALIQDLTEIQILQSEALCQRDFLFRLLESMQDLVMAIDAQGKISFASGRHAPFLKGKNLFQLTRPLGDFAATWDLNSLEQSSEAVEAQIVLDDEHLQLELIFSRFSHGTDYGLVVGRNISAIRRLERKIREQALFDSLTQIFNRHHLLPILEREIARARRTDQPLGMVFFDIDKFKTFNDTYGHHGGDKALRELGQLMRSILRKGTDYPCRFGGDEFVIISSNADLQGVRVVAERLQQQFRLQHRGEVSLSIGMSLLEPEDTAQSLLERCDKANYQAKAQGGNAIVHLQTTILP